MREALMQVVGTVVSDAAIVVTFMLPIFLVGYYVHRKKAAYKAEASEPFTELPLRPPGESLRLKIERLSEEFDEALVVMALTAAVASIFVVGNPKSWPTWLGAGLFAGVS